MAGFNKIITAPMSKAISIAVLAGCLLLGVLVGMSPKYTAGSSSGSNGTNLRNPATQEAASAPAVAPQQQEQQPQKKSSDNSETPARISGAKLLNFAAQTVPEDNEDKAEGAVDNFVWNDHFPSFEDYDFDTLALLEDIEDDSEFSYSFEFVNSPTTPLSLSYEF